jgi:hypothetical protein
MTAEMLFLAAGRITLLWRSTAPEKTVIQIDRPRLNAQLTEQALRCRSSKPELS